MATTSSNDSRKDVILEVLARQGLRQTPLYGQRLAEGHKTNIVLSHTAGLPALRSSSASRLDMACYSCSWNPSAIIAGRVRPLERIAG